MAVAFDPAASIDRAEEEILKVLAQHAAPMSARVVTEHVQRLGVDKTSIVSAIWFLIDRNAIRLTSDLKIVPGA
jgi:hypothetical protein